MLAKLLVKEVEAPGKWIDDIRKTKQEIELIEEERYGGALARARARHVAAEEAPPKRALGIQIGNTELGGVASDESEHIKGAFIEYYKELFALHHADTNTFEDRLLEALPRLNDEKIL